GSAVHVDCQTADLGKSGRQRGYRSTIVYGNAIGIQTHDIPVGIELGAGCAEVVLLGELQFLETALSCHRIRIVQIAGQDIAKALDVVVVEILEVVRVSKDPEETIVVDEFVNRGRGRG